MLTTIVQYLVLQSTTVYWMNKRQWVQVYSQYKQPTQMQDKMQGTPIIRYANHTIRPKYIMSKIQYSQDVLHPKFNTQKCSTLKIQYSQNVVHPSCNTPKIQYFHKALRPKYSLPKTEYAQNTILPKYSPP